MTATKTTAIWNDLAICDCDGDVHDECAYPTCAAPDCNREVSDDDSDVCDNPYHREYSADYDPHDRDFD